MKNYGIVLTEEDLMILLNDEVEDDELDEVSGGCCVFNFKGSGSSG